MDLEKGFPSSPKADNAYPCDHCNQVFTSERQYTRHQNYSNSYRGYECPENGCEQAFIFKSQLKSHLNIHYRTRPFVCTFSGCRYRGGTRSQLAQHAITHGLGYVYLCEHCEYKATTSSNLRRHSRLHFNTRPYTCPHCPHTFFEISSLRRHVLDSAHHPGLPLYVCPWCSAPKDGPSPVGFNSSTLAWRHLLSTHADKLKAPETLKSTGRKPGETLTAHDVSLVFGLYRPQKDGKFRPSSEVRRTCNFFKTCQPSSGKPSSRPCKLSSQSDPPSTVPMDASSSSKSHENPSRSRLDDQDVDDPVSASTSKRLGLCFSEVQGVVMLPGEALWSGALLEAELSRSFSSSGQCNKNPIEI